MTQNIIECTMLEKTFVNQGIQKEIVKNFNLHVMENEFVVLFGPGQCGKTTLIRLMSGLQEKTSGSVKVYGKEVDGPSSEKGVVFQNIALFPWLTCMGNVEYGLKMAKIPKAKRREIAQHYIDLVGLTGFENEYPSRLSGGMNQRVGIARAYAINPKVLLMDEPFGALDAQTRYLMQEEVQRIWQKEKRTIVFVTNNIEEAIYLADRIVVLSSCPASVKKEYKIDLPRPRSYVSPEFFALRGEITHILDKEDE